MQINILQMSSPQSQVYFCQLYILFYLEDFYLIYFVGALSHHYIMLFINVMYIVTFLKKVLFGLHPLTIGTPLCIDCFWAADEALDLVTNISTTFIGQVMCGKVSTKSAPFLFLFLFFGLACENKVSQQTWYCHL